MRCDQFPKVYLQYYDEDYRGVHALTKISNDEKVVYIPLSVGAQPPPHSPTTYLILFV
jgi:hypothetical protein